MENSAFELSDQQNRESLEAALTRTLSRLRDPAPIQNRNHPREPTIATLEKFKELLVGSTTEREIIDTVSSTFARRTLSKEPTLFTGYFQPRLKGSLTETSTARFPIYRSANVQNLSRKSIDCDAALRGAGLEIAWVTDAIDLFFLHVQGSGILELEDGSQKQIIYDGNNNLPYVSIGKYLIEKGILSSVEISAQKIKSYLRSNPEKCQDILNLNPRYIYFRLAEAGPIGTLGTILTPMRSIASDWDICPPGALGLVETTLPAFDSREELSGTIPASFFVFNHDTGSAIKGANRIDVYCGTGNDAWNLAGHLKHNGRFSLVGI